MAFKAFLAGLVAALFLAACVPVPVPLIIPAGGTGPVQRLGADTPRSASIDQALNKVRADNGRAALVSNAALDQVAAQYAAELAVGDKLMMGLPTGAKAGDRIRAAGISRCTAGEVISQGYRSGEAALSAWLSNPQQSRILLNQRYANYGFGTAPDRAGRGADVWVMVLLMACPGA